MRDEQSAVKEGKYSIHIVHKVKYSNNKAKNKNKFQKYEKQMTTKTVVPPVYGTYGQYDFLKQTRPLWRPFLGKNSRISIAINDS